MLKLIDVKLGRIKVDDNGEKKKKKKKKKFIFKKKKKNIIPVISGGIGHRWIPVYGIPFFY